MSETTKCSVLSARSDSAYWCVARKRQASDTCASDLQEAPVAAAREEKESREGADAGGRVAGFLPLVPVEPVEKTKVCRRRVQ